jgi:3-methyladenine DNA glycosylase/8-oxoguanine DNA glycosylase
MKPLIPVSVGELIDKITILEIKQQQLRQPEQLRHVEHELLLLRAVLAELPLTANAEALASLTNALRGVNEQLWQIEDAIRLEERLQRFEQAFIRLARSVYQRNDERAALKRSINNLVGSTLIEEKSYEPYD